MTPQSSLAEALGRPAPPLGGFRLAVVRLEIRRLMRNRRTMILAIAMPIILFLAFGRNSAYVHQSAGRGNVTAFEMISIALFGAVFATATGGAMVSIERALGWSRQLRVTPLSPVAYIVDQDADITHLGCGRRGCCVLDRRRHQPGVDAYLSVGRHRTLRVGRVALVLRPRTVHRLSASLRERHPDHLSRLDAVCLCRRLVHSGQPFPGHRRHAGRSSPRCTGSTSSFTTPWSGASSIGRGCSTLPYGWEHSCSGPCGSSAVTPLGCEDVVQAGCGVPDSAQIWPNLRREL